MYILFCYDFVLQLLVIGTNLSVCALLFLTLILSCVFHVCYIDEQLRKLD